MIYGVEDEWTTLAKLPVSKTTLRLPPKILQVVNPPVPPSFTAVRFDNEGTPANSYNSVAALTVDSQSVPNAYTFTLSFYCRSDAMQTLDLMSLGDNSGNQFSILEMIGVATTSASIEIFFTDPTGAAFAEFIFNEHPINFNYFHLFMSVDLNHPAGSKICNCLINGVAMTINTGAYTDGDPAFQIGFNGGNFGIPDMTANLGPGFGYILDFQEIWIALGQYVDPSNIALFREPITGDPVDLGTDGSVPTGTPPTYYFKGNAAQFPINRGSGEQPHLVGGAPDRATVLTDAP
jgi:hypothetical protein